MSEQRTVDVEFQEANEDVLLDALTEMGYKYEVHEQPVELDTYNNRGIKPKAHIVIRKNQFGGYTDVGFERQSGANYKVHLDSMDGRKFKLGELKQNFAVASIKKFVNSRSKFSVKKQVREGKKIKIFLNVNY